jgi:O-antigen/teichoic acid export membrane protein
MNLFGRARDLLVTILYPQAVDTSTGDGRARERYRRAAVTTITSLSARGMTLLTVVISVPLTLRYLGTERYAVWMTISSLIAMLTFADLGIGNGLLNAVSESHGKGDPDLAAGYISSAFFLLCGMAGAVILGGAVVYPFVSWASLFNLSSPLAIKESGPAAAVFVICFALNLPFGVVQRVQMGYQQGFINDLWSVIGKVLGLVALLLGIYRHAGLPWLVLAMTGVPVLACIANTWVVFGHSRPWLRPKWSKASKKAAVRLLHMGGYFFILQTSVAVATSSDNFIAARLLGPAAVTEFSIAARMFSIVPLMLIMAMNPLWPAYGESIARGEVGWAVTTLRRSLVLTFCLTSASCVFLIFCGHWLLRLWVGPEMNLSMGLLVAIGASTVLTTAANAVGVFLNGANLMKVEVISAISVAIGAIVFKVFFVSRMGLTGLPLGTILAYSLFVWVPIVLFVPRLLSEMRLSYCGQCAPEFGASD